MTRHSAVTLSWGGEPNSDELAAPVHFQPRDPRDPSGQYIANDNYDYDCDSDSDSDNFHDSNHLQQLEAFGDELRASMANRRPTETQQRPRSWAWRPSRVLWNRNRAVQESVQDEGGIAVETEDRNDGDGVEKSIRTVAVSDHGSVDEEQPAASALSLTQQGRHRLVSYFVVFPDPPSDEFHDEEEPPPDHPSAISWQWNWNNLGRCISVIVVLEVVLVMGLLIAFLKEQ